MAPLYGSCPDCGAKAPLSAFTQGPEFGQLLERLIDDLPNPVAAHLIGYLRLHSKKGRALAAGKAMRLVTELAQLTTAPQVSWEREPRACTPETWAAAMDEAARSAERGELSLPLDGHRWLRKVAWTRAGQAQAKAEHAHEQSRRGATPVATHASHKPYDPNPKETPAEAAARIAAAKRLGLTPGDRT